MFNYRTIAVMKRELREKLFSKTFIFMTLLIPLLMFVMLGFQTLVMTYEGDEDTTLIIVSETEQITEKMRNEFLEQPFVKKGYYKIDFKTMGEEEFGLFLNSVREDLLEEKLTGVVYIPSTALQTKNVEYFSKNPNNNIVFKKIEGIINSVLVDLYFGNKLISSKDIKYLSKGIDFNSFRISRELGVEKEGYGNLVVSFLLTFLLYFSLIFLGTMMMRSVVAEKTNRIVEVLLSSVNPLELMVGKILGTGITGLAQMAIWLSPLILVISTSWFTLPEDFIFSMKISYVFYFLFNFFVGLITFLGLFAMVGAIFDNDQDAQSGIWPIMMLIMIPFFVAISLPSNPTSPIAKIVSMVPFGSLMVMPARMSITEVPVIEIIIATIINLLTMFGVFWLSAKIYRVGILKTGKKPKWNEVVQWLKYSG